MPNDNHKIQKPNDRFIKMQDLYKFKVFNPAYSECLTGTEWGVFMYILSEKLLFIRNDPTHYNGNTIKLDQEFKISLLSSFKISLSTYERLITKLCKGGILYRIKKDWYAVNPYCFARGKDLTITTEMMIFRKTTLNLKEGQSPFLTRNKKESTVEESPVSEPAPDSSHSETQSEAAPLQKQKSVSDAAPNKHQRTINRFLKKEPAPKQT